MKSMKLTSGLSGLAGEYLVAAELTKLGHIASLTLRNARGIDILVSNTEAGKAVGIQVKTSKGNAPCWVLNKKVEGFYSDNLFYVFCNLNNGGAPSFFVVPSKVVASFSKENHMVWLKTPGRKGQGHKDSSMRKFIDEKKTYLNRWDLLGI